MRRATGARTRRGSPASSAARRSTSATTPAATSPRTGARCPSCSRRWWPSWPVEVERIALVGHSMGGLVARSACHYAGADGARWVAPRASCGVARHAAHGGAAGAGRPRAHRRPRHRARGPPVRRLPAPPQRGHPRPPPRLARGRGLGGPRPRRAEGRRPDARCRCSRAPPTASSPPRSRAAPGIRWAACSATCSCSRRAPPGARATGTSRSGKSTACISAAPITWRC